MLCRIQGTKVHSQNWHNSGKTIPVRTEATFCQVLMCLACQQNLGRRDWKEKLESHLEVTAEISMNASFTFLSVYTDFPPCFFGPMINYSNPVSQRSQLPVLGEGTWQGRLQLGSRPRLHQPCWERPCSISLGTGN